MTLPLLDLSRCDPTDLLTVLRREGAVRVVHDALTATALDAARGFFALPDEEKLALDIARSPHFRGYSRMHNERDFREQIHFGRESAPAAGPAPQLRLVGPNLWPQSPAFRATILEYLAGAETAASHALDLVARALGLDAQAWLGASPYVLLKLIGYHAQADANSAPRRGVAAHLDFSLLTLTLQDDVGGLEVRRPDGTWLRVVPRESTWLLHLGELLPYVAGPASGLVATPHRVVNPSTRRMRCSLPFFLAPSLDTVLARAKGAPAARTPDDRHEHVHAVLDMDAAPQTLAYGPAEWRRKGENVWCAVCCTNSR